MVAEVGDTTLPAERAAVEVARHPVTPPASVSTVLDEPAVAF